MVWHKNVWHSLCGFLIAIIVFEGCIMSSSLRPEDLAMFEGYNKYPLKVAVIPNNTSYV